ncbi:MAG: hypothetical protein AMXMBFR84_25820 [Candidatus Hydrogenedentota bacterium]
MKRNLSLAVCLAALATLSACPIKNAPELTLSSPEAAQFPVPPHIDAIMGEPVYDVIQHEIRYTILGQPSRGLYIRNARGGEWVLVTGFILDDGSEHNALQFFTELSQDLEEGTIP